MARTWLTRLMLVVTTPITAIASSGAAAPAVATVATAATTNDTTAATKPKIVLNQLLAVAAFSFSAASAHLVIHSSIFANCLVLLSAIFCWSIKMPCVAFFICWSCVLPCSASSAAAMSSAEKASDTPPMLGAPLRLVRPALLCEGVASSDFCSATSASMTFLGSMPTKASPVALLVTCRLTLASGV